MFIMNRQKFKQISTKFKRQIKLYKLVLKDRRTPLLPKIILGAAVGYLLLPFDLIPDFIPVIGQLDDLIIIPALVCIAVKLIPKQIITEYKIELGIQISLNLRNPDT